MNVVEIEEAIKERPLFDILSDPYYDDNTEATDDAISFLEGKISYGLALLSKPLYDIKAPDSVFPRFIEMGAHRPETRRLIELNIPRETAIYLTENYGFTDIENKQQLIRQIRNIRTQLPYWYKIQLNTL
jgi:hypothetical protein